MKNIILVLAITLLTLSFFHDDAAAIKFGEPETTAEEQAAYDKVPEAIRNSWGNVWDTPYAEIRAYGQTGSGDWFMLDLQRKWDDKINRPVAAKILKGQFSLNAGGAEEVLTDAKLISPTEAEFNGKGHTVVLKFATPMAVDFECGLDAEIDGKPVPGGKAWEVFYTREKLSD